MQSPDNVLLRISSFLYRDVSPRKNNVRKKFHFSNFLLEFENDLHSIFKKIKNQNQN